MRKRITGMLILGCMLIGNIGKTYQVYAAETTDLSQRSEEQDISHPTGLMQIEVVNAGEIEESDIYDAIESENSKNLWSSTYASEWDAYSSNYIYNMLSDEERALWDSLDASCIQVLLGTDSLDDDYIPFVYCGDLDWNDVGDVAYMFRYSNPQYYFLNTSLASGVRDDCNGNIERYVAFGVYSAFKDGSVRNTATQSVKNQVDAWKNIANAYGSEAEKVKVLHDLIVEKVDYNDDIYNSSFNEDTAYSQSAYSVFCTDRTVCAGYAQAFEMMCNAVGVDCIAVTSNDHEWNKVRINDSWYNVDCTWADQPYDILYSYFERSDAYYDSDSAYYANSHAEEDYWTAYLPACTLDSGACGTEPGALPVISQTTAQPEITIESNGDNYTVSIESATPDAIIYYTLNGDTPTPAYTRAYKYTTSLALRESCTIKAVAVHDTFWDSSVASKNTSEARVVHKSEPFVKLLYQYVLDRNAEQSEIDYWVERLENGSTGAEVAYGFIFSTEFHNKNYSDEDYVEHLYLSLMGRSSDAAGKADWVTHLKNGVSRLYVFRQFTDSDEFGNLCSVYNIQRGTVALTEARDQNYNVTRFVARNYTEFLGRSYDVDGLNDWCGRINSGYGMDQVAYGFVFSAECTNMNLSNTDYVKMLYRGIFGREYDEAGLADWVNRLNTGTSREDVFWGFADSQEFTNMVASYGL